MFYVFWGLVKHVVVFYEHAADLQLLFKGFIFKCCISVTNCVVISLQGKTKRTKKYAEVKRVLSLKDSRM